MGATSAGRGSQFKALTSICVNLLKAYEDNFGEITLPSTFSPRPDMSHIDFGLSILSRTVFANYRQAAAIDLADICRDLSLSGQLAGFEVSERFYEIGSPRGLRDTEEFLSRRLDEA